MDGPGRINLSTDELSALLDRIENKTLKEEDYPLIADLIRSLGWIYHKLDDQDINLRRLRKIFGIGNHTEKTSNLVGQQDSKDKESSSDTDDQGENEPQGGTDNEEKKDGRKNRKSNRRSAKDFKKAIVTKIFHESLKVGERCPDCGSGNLRAVEAGKVLRITGQPWLQAHVYELERFRCNTCGKTFTAVPPEEVVRAPKYDKTAKAIVSLLKYGGGFPFYRQESLQTILDTPISDSSLWKMTRDVANCLAPVHEELIREAAKGECIHNDDTKARILDLIQENKEYDDQKERTGIFTSAILSKLDDREIALFFTGRNHAGENLNDLLDKRPENMSKPIQMCDASNNNRPKDHETNESNCLSHLRRKFYDLMEVWPKYVLPIISDLNEVFRHEREAKEKKLDPEDRLNYHRKKSTPVMSRLKDYCNNLIEEKKTEPNSNLGKAISYLNNHWLAFTLFLRIIGVPLDNNADERLMKRAVLNRKNGLFFKTVHGAWVGDVLLSFIETCRLNSANPYDYFIAIQTYPEEIEWNPSAWFPWNYTETVEAMAQSLPVPSSLNKSHCPIVISPEITASSSLSR